ncbi:MAG: hypothetical protein IT582_04175 [Opitutaceae bacterium]|nr:hypothetical protein [Opitutaceae bacterium]
MNTTELTQKLLEVLANGDCITTETDEHGFELVTDEPVNGEVRISWVANVSGPKGIVGKVLTALAHHYTLRLTAMGEQQAEYYETIGFVRAGRDMVLAKSSE